MTAGAFYKPKKSKTKPLGEDAHFICDEQQTIGVADGVGGWAKHARNLMENAIGATQKQPKGNVDPKKVLVEAFQNNYAKGSSTVCIITLKDNYLHALNLGDSGFRSAEEIFVPVEAGDMIVAATDGNLASLAVAVSRCKHVVSPFTVAAVEAGFDCEAYKGGKYDDVTVVVAYISSDDPMEID
ncbi:OLC1v1021489C1 [Oldenlandia corymbosa var. corymbosa]|uniref:Protein phosphatase n=1 Tax=Oldenlandia corymbosa var. corymbosa TaxID=529605 RepID=A0AAV1BX03_OLDCO|nr:OLC1v1021489C1 [Oldenlandia corymbosa var. corymbosa]